MALTVTLCMVPGVAVAVLGAWLCRNDPPEGDNEEVR